MSGSHEVIAGDSLLRLREIEADKVDAVITDPPYSSGGAFRSDRAKSTGAKYLSSEGSANELPDFFGDNRTDRALLAWSSIWMAECWRIARQGAAIAVFTDWRSLPTFSDALQVAGWTWRGVGVWVKPQARSRPTKGGLWNNSEFILWGSRGERHAEQCLPGSWATTAPSRADRLHQTEKPPGNPSGPGAVGAAGWCDFGPVRGVGCYSGSGGD